MKDRSFITTRSAILASLSLAAAALMIPYVDGNVAASVRRHREAGIYALVLYDALRPVIVVITHGTTLIAGSVILYLWGRFSSRKSVEDLGRLLVAGFLASGLAVQILKHLIGRARPRIGDPALFIGPNLRGDYDSFPSGHTTVAFCLAALLSSRFPRYAPAIYGFAVLAAFDRVAGLSHFPSDVIAGGLLGIVTARVLIAKMTTTE